MYNKVILMGRLTADPDLRQTPNNVPVVTFSIAVQRKFSNKENERQTDFFNIVAWRNQAEFISKFFTKGKSILIEGELQNRQYTTKEGEKRIITEIIVDSAHFTPEPKNASGSANAQYTSENHPINSATSYAAFNAANNNNSDFSVAADDNDDYPF